nr:hypothetical protein [Kibdelosporangium sp. MJ126-NF4]CEL15082.1 hypothetical protein [Kibdelosporangium sp. MJ126-NF4]CTQ93324.1 hypothetical protein [Kibdelosporangium sp. MJ126-NF4]
MYTNYPDGLTDQAIDELLATAGFYDYGPTNQDVDELLAEVDELFDNTADEPTSVLLDETAARRRTRRIERRTLSGTVRTLPLSRISHPGPDDKEAA